MLLIMLGNYITKVFVDILYQMKFHGVKRIYLSIFLGTDVMPAISIAHETAEADIMKLKPRDPKTQTLVTSQYVIRTFAFFSPLNVDQKNT